MFMVDLVRWWYFRGWGVFVSDLKRKLRDSADFFSIGILFRTFFKPFRQIAANEQAGAADSKLAIFFDKLISRIVGMFTRLFLIIFGVIMMILEVLLGGILIIIWPIVPILPLVGIIMAVIGVTF